MGELRIANKILVGRTERKERIRRLSHGLQHVKIAHKETECQDVERIVLALYISQWRPLVKNAMCLWVSLK
jgi:hypothetical protein